MAEDWDLFQVGMKLGAIRDLLRPLKAQGARYQQLEKAVATVAVSTRGSEKAPTLETRIDTDEYFLGRILLGMLQRGHAPLASPFVESVVLDHSGARINSLQDEGHEVRFCLDFDEGEAEQFSQALCDSLSLTDERVTANWSRAFDSIAERTFVERHLAPLLGGGISLLEAQRPLVSMLEAGHLSLSDFVDQRVDFAIESPSGARIAIEIDGPHHQFEPQRTLDRKRDHVLRTSGWHVERIPVERLNGESVFSLDILRRIEADAVLGHLKTLAHQPQGRETLKAETVRLTASVHSVARVQLAVLLALLDGTLHLDSPSWDIAVIERDLSCAQLAVADLLEQLVHLGSIYDISAGPHVNLFVRDESDLGFERLEVTRDQPVELHYLTSDQMLNMSGDLDLLVDVSVRARPADRFETFSRDSFLLGQARRSFVMRTAYRRAPESFLHWPAPRPVNTDRTLTEDLTYFLQLLFRKPSFRDRQVDVILRALERQSVIGLLPTGGGKSIIFQLPTLLSPGVALVIAPLRALIGDQEDNLHRTGVNRVVAIHGGRETSAKVESLKSISSGSPRFIYVAPERMQMAEFRDEVGSSPIARSVAFVVVDEAHCVSEWGHDFRPAYLNVGRIARNLCRTDRGEPPILALTGTASNSVLLDIERELEFDRLDERNIVSVDSFARENLNFIPVMASAARKREALFNSFDQVAKVLDVDAEALLDDNRIGGLIFCRNVKGKFGVDEVSRVLRSYLGQSHDTIRMFSGSQPRSFSGNAKEWNAFKLKTQRDYKDDKFPILVATSSFGMGIDKPNIRYTVHYGIPGSLESLAQEAGRAGRKRAEKAACAVIFTDQDLEETQDFLSSGFDAEEARVLANAVPWSKQGDASRIMYLHFLSYKGVEADVAATRLVLNALRRAWKSDGLGPGEKGHCFLARSRSDDQAKQQEQALYRLSLLGIVLDYTVDYGRHAFSVESRFISAEESESKLVEYVRRYDTEDRARSVLQQARSRESDEISSPYDHVIQELSSFIYDVIEKARRQALRNVVDTMRKCGDDGVMLRKELEVFLSSNVFSASVSEMVNADTIDPGTWWTILDEVKNAALATRLVATCRRELESNPNLPGLLFLEGLGAVHAEYPDPGEIATTLNTGLDNYANLYDANEKAVAAVAHDLVTRMSIINPGAFEQVIAALVHDHRSRIFARAAYLYVSEPDLKRACATSWIASIMELAEAYRIEVAEGT